MAWIQPSTYTPRSFTYTRPPDFSATPPARHPVVIVGAGPVGLTAALDLARHGIPVVLIEKSNAVSLGSRAICFSKRTLDIAERLGAGTHLVDKGVTWSKGKVFFREELVYEFDLQPESGYKNPAFINLQQYYFEEHLIDQATTLSAIDLRWGQEVIDMACTEEGCSITVDTPEGPYTIESRYLLACDGSKSPIRDLLKLPFEGEAFEEHFLIADVVMTNDFPTERWFWFDPPFNPGKSALLHKQPDDVWRIDLQLGRTIDREAELDPERIKNRLQAMLGDQVLFELEWTSIYQFKCLQLPSFRQGPVFFIGDSAHQVSPFGARGANGGIQDADNFAWKLAYVLKNWAPKSLLDTYDLERLPASKENIKHSTQATDFISPKSDISLIFRNELLDLAAQNRELRRLVNSGRLSQPYHYLDSPLTCPDTEAFNTPLYPGSPAVDAPITLDGQPAWLLDELGTMFTLIYGVDPNESAEFDLQSIGLNFPFPFRCIPLKPSSLKGGFVDTDGLVKERYDLNPGTWYLIRPDQYIAARGRELNKGIDNALTVAIGNAMEHNKTGPAYSEHPEDDAYNDLLACHEGLSIEESHRLNSRLVLLLLNQVTDPSKRKALFEQALAGITSDSHPNQAASTP